MPQMSGKHLRWEMSLYDPNQPWRIDGHYPVGKSGVSQKKEMTGKDFRAGILEGEEMKRLWRHR